MAMSLHSDYDLACLSAQHATLKREGSVSLADLNSYKNSSKTSKIHKNLNSKVLM